MSSCPKPFLKFNLKNRNIFNTKRYFTISDYFPSHKQLLIRSSKTNENSKNIDVVFFGVNYLQIPTSFKGMSIDVLDKDDLIITKELETFRNLGNNYIFKISSEKSISFLVASFVRVFENSLEFNETSLGISNGTKGREVELIRFI